MSTNNLNKLEIASMQFLEPIHFFYGDNFMNDAKEHLHEIMYTLCTLNPKYDFDERTQSNIVFLQFLYEQFNKLKPKQLTTEN